MQRRTKLLIGVLGAGAATLAWIPAIGQEAPQSLLPPGFGSAPPAPTRAAPPPAAPAPAPSGAGSAQPAAPAAPPPAQLVPPVVGADEGVAITDDARPFAEAVLRAATPPEEMPPAARRSLDLVGRSSFYGQDLFGEVDGRYVGTLMRRLDAPIASRWAEIVLRRVLLSPTPAPVGEGKADWVADRAALLLRLGEADAARMLVQGVDVDNFSPRLRRVAIETALATADPAGLCPIPDGSEQVSGQPAWPMIRAMCATMFGDEGTANAAIGRAPPGDPIDHALAEKSVAAGGGGRRRVQIDWTAVDALTGWRFGLASALGVAIPQTLLDAAPVWFKAWLARAPMLSTADRIAPARIAAALGPFSSADLIDLYGRAMDESGEDNVNTDPGRLRAAYRGDDDDARLSAMHALWDAAQNGRGGERDRYAASILTSRAAARITPSLDQTDDVAPLVASMLSAGLDRQAERWAAVAEQAGGTDGDRAWAMLAVGATRPVVRVTTARIKQLADRAGEAGRHRTAMLVGALAGLGRLSNADAAKIAADAGVTLGAPTPYARALQRAVAAHEQGTVALLVAVGMQTPRWQAVPAADFHRMISALEAVGMDGEARMIAAEAMARL